MSQKATKKPLAIALGAAFVTSLAGTPVANAADNPFAMSDMSSGYKVAEMGKEGKCGGSMKMEGKEDMAGEGMDKMKKEGKCGESHKEVSDGKCGGNMKGMDKDKMKAENMDKMKKEGKCGEGKCGANKAAAEKMDKMKKEGKCGGSK